MFLRIFGYNYDVRKDICYFSLRKETMMKCNTVTLLLTQSIKGIYIYPKMR